MPSMRCRSRITSAVPARRTARPAIAASTVSPKISVSRASRSIASRSTVTATGSCANRKRSDSGTGLRGAAASGRRVTAISPTIRFVTCSDPDSKSPAAMSRCASFNASQIPRSSLISMRVARRSNGKLPSSPRSVTKKPGLLITLPSRRPAHPRPIDVCNRPNVPTRSIVISNRVNPNQRRYRFRRGLSCIRTPGRG